MKSIKDFFAKCRIEEGEYYKFGFNWNFIKWLRRGKPAWYLMLGYKTNKEVVYYFRLRPYLWPWVILKRHNLRQTVKKPSLWKRFKAFIAFINEPFAVELLEFPDSMATERYNSLMRNPQAKLTSEEVNQGYRFCCEWDGLLIHHTHPEAMSCSCLKACGYRIMTQEEWRSLPENRNANASY